MKKINLLAMLALISGFIFTACDDDPEPNNLVTIEGIPATAAIENLGTLGPVNATITAQDGLASVTVTKDGDTYLEPEFEANATSLSLEFSYTAEEADADQNIVFVFTATDVDGDEESVTHVLSVGEAPDVQTVFIKSGEISADETWETGNVYVLDNRVTVVSGVTLTIEPGVIVKGEAGTGANASALLVARGATLNAVGTPEQPIIFTSIADDIQPGQIVSPNLSPDQFGFWGGLIILGSAPISASNDNDEDVTEFAIEGIPATDENGLYGGNDPMDSSGEIAYISVRHGGSNIGAGNEINGISLGGVGSGTSISNVEVVGNADDGIEWYGGNVDITNALVWNAGDDALDTDQDWIGTCSNFVVVTPVNGSAFELDGPEGTLNRGRHTFSNGIVYAGELGEELIDFDESSNVDMTDIYFFGISTDLVVEEYTEMVAAGNGSVANFEYTLSAPQTEAAVFVGIPSSELTSVGENQNTVGADVSVFGWTWASQSGALEGIGLE
jgi:hypothetical protein